MGDTTYVTRRSTAFTWVALIEPQRFIPLFNAELDGWRTKQLGLNEVE